MSCTVVHLMKDIRIRCHIWGVCHAAVQLMRQLQLMILALSHLQDYYGA